MMSELVFTMDVEDWYHSENVVNFLPDKIPSHSSLPMLGKVLDILRSNHVKGTFFILGCVAKKNPNMISELAHEGHEIANHGWDHTILNKLDRDQTIDDIKRSTDILEDIINKKVIGYRSPCFSVNDWIFEVLYDRGYEYTSMGIRASFHDRYRDNAGYRKNIPDLELPVASILGLSIPATGGGWFRLHPLILQRLLIARSAQKPKIFYCHPWDFDELKPDIAKLPRFYRWRHTVNTQTALNKLRRLKFNRKPLMHLFKG